MYTAFLCFIWLLLRNMEPTPTTERLPLVTSIPDAAALKQQLESNPGVFIVKLGAEWCGPCKKIEGLVHSFMHQVPAHVQCAVVDVDQDFALYGFLKSKKVVSAIPAILVYNRGNVHYVPDDGVIGADPQKIRELFVRACS